MALGVIFCVFGFLVTSVWKFRYHKKVDLPIRLQWEPWKVNAMFWGIIVIILGLTALSFVMFGSPITHAKSFGDDPVGDAIICMALAVLLPSFFLWGAKHPGTALMAACTLFLLFLVSQLSSSEAGSGAKNLLTVGALLFIGATMIGGKIFFLIFRLFKPKFKTRTGRRLKKPKYSRNAAGRLVREKRGRRRNDDRRRRRDDDDDDEDDDD